MPRKKKHRIKWHASTVKRAGYYSCTHCTATGFVRSWFARQPCPDPASNHVLSKKESDD